LSGGSRSNLMLEIREPISDSAVSIFCCPMEELSANEQVDRNLLARFHPFSQVVFPSAKVVDPTGDFEGPVAGRVELDPRTPAIVAAGFHNHRSPLGSVRRSVQKSGGYQIVPVGKDIGLHDHCIADDALGRKPTVIHRRLHVFDNNAAQSVLRGKGQHCERDPTT
jgi:hypothetical protein